MRGKSFMFIIAISTGLVFFSCSDITWPKRVEIQGKMNLLVKLVSGNWGAAFTNVLQDAFSNSNDMSADNLKVEVYNVNYGQSAQTFCIYLHNEISNTLNPDDYLKGIEEKLYMQNTGEVYTISETFDMSAIGGEGIKIIVPLRIPVPGLSGAVTLPDFTIPVQYVYRKEALNMPGDFLHSIIMEGDMTIDMELFSGGTALDRHIVEMEKIDINQASLRYNNNPAFDGLAYSSVDGHSLNKKHFNNNDIMVNGELKSISGVTVAGLFTSDFLDIQLILTMSIHKFEVIDMKFENIGEKLNKPLSPISLEKVVDYVNYMQFDKYTEPRTGIGLMFTFSEIMNGFEMTVICENLKIDATKDLVQGSTIFGNEDKVKISLVGEDSIDALMFTLNLQPTYSDDVLRLWLDNGIEPGLLRIKGEAEFFQHWTEAELNMVNILRVSKSEAGEDPEGNHLVIGKDTMPAEGSAPIDLSLLTNYIPGFELKNMQANMYILAPHEAFARVEVTMMMLFDAIYDEGNNKINIYDKNLVLNAESVSMHGYLDAAGIYREKELPPGGNDFSHGFREIMYVGPKDLYFQYEMSLPPTLVVTPEMFDYISDGTNENDENQNALRVTILLWLPLELEAREHAYIKLPDLFNNQADLFGRKNANDRLFFNPQGVDVDYIKFFINFPEAFSRAGYLYIEEGEGILFPGGIRLDGNSIEVQVSRSEFDAIEEKLIAPDFRLEFDKGGSIVIPRNMGLTSVRLEAKGRFELEL